MLKTTFLVLSALSALVSADDFTYPDCEDKQVVVQLFEWSWDAIARECEDVLGPKGFCGVQARGIHKEIETFLYNNSFFLNQISPPHEHIQGGEWWTRYQPVSYVLNSRQEIDFLPQSMIYCLHIVKTVQEWQPRPVLRHGSPLLRGGRQHLRRRRFQPGMLTLIFRYIMKI